MTIKVLTWNFTGGGQDKWKFVLAREPDVALIQECHNPITYFGTGDQGIMDCILWRPKEGKSEKGNAIYVKNRTLRHFGLPNWKGWVVTGEANLNNIPTLIINIHTKFKVNPYVGTTFNQVIDELSTAFRAYKNIILGGDLNLSPIYGRKVGTPDKETLARLQTNFNLKDSTIKGLANEEEVPTTRWGYQNDYIFVSSNFKVLNFSVLRDGTPRSDHYPVIATLEGI